MGVEPGRRDCVYVALQDATPFLRPRFCVFFVHNRLTASQLTLCSILINLITVYGVVE